MNYSFKRKINMIQKSHSKALLEPSETFTMKLFYENTQRTKALSSKFFLFTVRAEILGICRQSSSLDLLTTRSKIKSSPRKINAFGWNGRQKVFRGFSWGKKGEMLKFWNLIYCLLSMLYNFCYPAAVVIPFIIAIFLICVCAFVCML